MIDDSTPGGNAGIVEPSNMDALAELLDDPLDEGTQEQQGPAEESEGDEPDEDEEDLPDGEPNEEDDEPDELKGGRFAPDTAKVRLPDGTTATVAELKRGSLREGDYTQKTQALARDREAVEAERARISQVAQEIHEGHERIQWALEQSRPQRPQVPYSEDPIAWGEYQVQEAQWREAGEYWKAERDKALASQKQQTEQQRAQMLQKEQDALFSAMPALRETTKRNAFIQEAVRVGQNYGLTEQEIRSVSDHRLLLLMRDAMAYRRMKDRAPAAKKDIEAAPKLVKGSKRTNPKAGLQRRREQNLEHLRSERSLDAGVRSLMDMDL